VRMQRITTSPILGALRRQKEKGELQSRTAQENLLFNVLHKRSVSGCSSAIHCASEHQSPRSGARRICGALQSAQSTVRANALEVAYIYTTTDTL
jgi:hypothetical protein